MARTTTLTVDLSDLVIDDIELLAQEGSRGMPEFAASTGQTCCGVGACSCVVEQPTEPETTR